ncbi:M20 family metallopeptidase [Anaerosinus massiliensis]|uniref:M20 family metallopeptidase n=1 Tax=Massilibacillus massiliensis TaxID=1806837 RepID=UPI000A73DA33|nr:M20 family metallopeptidase [Massilibacillus massiliensis]
MMKERAFAFIDQHREDMITLWRDFVNHDSGNGDKAGIDLLQAKIKEFLEALGAEVRIVEFAKAGNMLIAEIGAEREKAPILFLGHIDTVFKQGEAKKRPFTIKEGKAYGPGVLDMKGGVVASLYAAWALQSVDFSHRPIKILLAGDEENGHQNSEAAAVIVQEAAGASAVFNCETGFEDDALVIGRKGVANFTMETFGVAAHVGNQPEAGRSAIVEIAHKLLEIEKLTNRQTGISFNVGVIEGGMVSNATPDYAKIKIDIRFTKETDISIFRGQLQEIAGRTYVQGTTTKLTAGVCFKPMETTAGVEKLFSLVQETAQENHLGKLYAKTVGGASDSAYTVLSGAPTVCAMGVKGGRNHSKEEFAIVDSLFERAKLLIASVLKLA